jgi:Lrp/AsnC family transcriptional regulator, regulator for asnA, asnC and gidA
MDKTDQGIADILAKDGRASNAAMARTLKVSEGTVRRRLGAMLREGVVTVTGRVSPHLVGREHSVRMRVDTESPRTVIPLLGKLTGVEDVLNTTGENNIEFTLRYAHPDDFKAVVGELHDMGLGVQADLILLG